MMLIDEESCEILEVLMIGAKHRLASHLRHILPLTDVEDSCQAQLHPIA